MHFFGQLDHTHGFTHVNHKQIKFMKGFHINFWEKLQPAKGPTFDFHAVGVLYFVIQVCTVHDFPTSLLLDRL